MDEARARWRALACDLHPDRPGGDGDRLAAVNAAWDAIRGEDDATVLSMRPPREVAEAMNEALAEALISAGYARLGVTEADLPGLHIAAEIRMERGGITLASSAAASPGRNLLVHPRLTSASARPGDIGYRTGRMAVSEVEVDSAARHAGEIGSLRCRDGSVIPLRAAFDPGGKTHHAAAVKMLRGVALERALRKIGRAVGRQPRKNVLRRIVDAVGLG